jgi:acetyl-CoA acetyltransferase
VMLASQAIKAGDAECIVAGGQESMSTAPHYVYGMRSGIKAGNQTMVDGMIHDGLWDSFGCCHMGEYAEYTAEKAGVSRADQDAFSYDSHRKAVAYYHRERRGSASRYQSRNPGQVEALLPQRRRNGYGRQCSGPE